MARAEYAQGKSLVFRQLVCRACPIQRRGFNRDQARSLMTELNAVLNVFQDTADEDSGTVRALCSGQETGCSAKLNAVRRYLDRRYKLGGRGT